MAKFGSRFVLFKDISGLFDPNGGIHVLNDLVDLFCSLKITLGLTSQGALKIRSFFMIFFVLIFWLKSMKENLLSMISTQGIMGGSEGSAYCSLGSRETLHCQRDH